MNKFQILDRRVRVSGVVVGVDGTDFDLALDACFWRLRLAFPLFPVLHCESYGVGDLPGSGGVVLPLGRRVAVSGALVLDNYVHASERKDHQERVVQRGLLRAFRPKPELHPYDPASVVLDAGPVQVEDKYVFYHEEVYSPDWIACKLLGLAGEGVGRQTLVHLECGGTA